MATVAVRSAATGDDGSVRRASQLSVALAALAQELASARHEIRALKRENAALMSGLNGGMRDVSETGRHERSAARPIGFAWEPAVNGDRGDALGCQQVVGCSIDVYRRSGSRPALAGLIAGDLLNRTAGRRSLLLSPPGVR